MRNTKATLGDPSSSQRNGLGYGTISTVDPIHYSCLVDLDDGSGVYVPFPNLTQGANGCGGSVTVPQSGQRVLVHFNNGNALIIQSVPVYHDAGLSDFTTPRTTEVPITARTNPRCAGNYRGNMPKDLLEGDQMQVGPRGEVLGILARSGVILGASKNAEIRATGGPVDGMAIKGRKTTLSSDFGEVAFKSVAGKSSFSFLGGTDQTLETGRDRQNWTTRVTVGEGGKAAQVGFYDREGKTLNEHVVETDGGDLHEIAGRESRIVRGSSYHEVGLDRTVVIPTGGDTLQVDGVRAVTIGGNYTRDVSQNFSAYIKNDRSDSINRDWSVSVGRNAGLSISGVPLQAKPGDVAYKQMVSNGDYVIDIGTPGTELGGAMSGYKLTVWPAGGNIEMKSVLGDMTMLAPAGKISLTGNLGIEGTGKSVELTALTSGKITLGTMMEITSGGKTVINAPQALIAASAGVAINPAVLWTELIAYLDALTIGLDTHLHQTTYPFSPTLVPMVPTFNAILQAQKMLFQSKKVMFGG
jgi:hypothetical protein